MLRRQLTSLIPDEPFREFAPIAYMALPALRLLYARSVQGYQGIGRRVWTREGGGADGWIVLDETVQRVHCQSDAERIVEFNRPPIRVLEALERYHLEVSDSGDGTRTATWHHNGLSIVSLVKGVGPFLIEATVVSDGPTADETTARRALRRLEDSVGADAHSSGPCLGRWAAVMWQLVYEIPWFITFLFVPYTIGYLIGPNPLPLFTMLVGLVLYLYISPKRVMENRYRRLLKQWSRVCQQGDLDGTVARALVSVGRSSPTPAEPIEAPPNGQ